MALAERLTSALKEQELTQTQVAKDIGASRAAVSGWCSGQKRPTQDNLEALAGVLGVTAAWLQYGDGAPPARDSRKERASYRDDLRWYWRGAPADQGRELGNAAGFAFDVDMSSVGRETGQNSLDELLDGEQTVTLEYTVIELAGQDLARFKKALRFEEDLLPHLEAAATGQQKASTVIRSSLERLQEDDRLFLLQIADYNATGLIGPEYDSGRFMAVCRNTLDSQKSDETSGGSYGLGKATMWAASGFGLVITNSTLSVPEEGSADNRFFARMEIPWHEYGGEAWAGPAWFGEWDDVHECTRSYSGNQTLAKDLYVNRERSGPGATFAVVGAYDPSGSAQDVDAIAEELTRAAAESFWAAMVPRGEGEPARLQVIVRTQRGRKQLSERVVDPKDYVSPLVEMLGKHYDDEVVDALDEEGDVVRATVVLQVPERAEDGEHDPVEHEATLLVAQLDPTDEDSTPRALNKVSWLRGNLMRIRESKLTNLPLGARPFHAVLLAGTADGDDAANRHAERFLRAAEPPAHDKWTSTPEVTARYAWGARRRLDEFETRVKQTIREIVRAGSSEKSDGPDSLKQLLRLIPPPQDNAKRPRVKGVQASLDKEGAWQVEATVAIPPRRTGWRFAPVLKFGTESGPAIPVEWESLIASSRCEVRDGRVYSGPRARSVQFHGATDPKSHPVSSSRARVFLDLRDVRPQGVEDE